MPAAIFYDLENMGISNMSYDNALQTVGKMMAQIRTCPLLRDAAVQKAYVRHGIPQVTMLRNILKEHAVELVEVSPLDKAPKKPNLVDFKLFGDAMELLGRSRKITTLGLASGDNDFGFLCEAAKRMGKQFVLISRGEAVGGALVALSEDWVNVTEDYGRFKVAELWLRRHPPEALPQGDWTVRLPAMLARMSEDLLLRRYARLKMINGGVMKQVLERYASLPDYKFLGFPSFTDFMAYLTRDTGFCVAWRNENSFLMFREDMPEEMSLVEPAAPLDPEAVFRRGLGLPGGYSREKAELWWQFFKEQGPSLSEMKAYLALFESCGLIREGDAPGETRFLPKNQRKQAMLEYLAGTMERKRYPASEKQMKEFVREL